MQLGGLVLEEGAAGPLADLEGQDPLVLEPQRPTNDDGGADRTLLWRAGRDDHDDFAPADREDDRLIAVLGLDVGLPRGRLADECVLDVHALHGTPPCHRALRRRLGAEHAIRLQ